jgi:hypothetical protein
MRRRIELVLLALVGLLGTGVTTAHAVDSPNAPAAVSASSNSASNAATSAGRLRVSWEKPVVDSTHPIPISYEVVATDGSQRVSATIGMGSISTVSYTHLRAHETG